MSKQTATTSTPTKNHLTVWDALTYWSIKEIEQVITRHLPSNNITNAVKKYNNIGRISTPTDMFDYSRCFPFGTKARAIAVDTEPFPSIPRLVRIQTSDKTTKASQIQVTLETLSSWSKQFCLVSSNSCFPLTTLIGAVFPSKSLKN